jgi:CheY-like chemotaxis protein
MEVAFHISQKSFFPEGKLNPGAAMAGPVKNADCVLIVEDDPMVRKAMVSLLQGEGYQAHAAANGQEALHFLQQHQPPMVILLDMEMPVMDGWEFRHEQERNPLLAGIPVILLSSVENLEGIAATLRAHGCLHKPLEASRLFSVLEHSFPA